MHTVKENFHPGSFYILEVGRLRAFAKSMQVHESLYKLEIFGLDGWLGALLVYIQVLDILDMYRNYQLLGTVLEK